MVRNITKRAWFVFAFVFLFQLPVQAKNIQDPSRPFHLVIHVATTNPKEIEARVGTLVLNANRHFLPAGISFSVVDQKQLPDTFAVLETIRERRQLKRYMVPRTINLFLVDEILDPHPSAATRRASAWQGRKPSGRLAGAHIEIKNRVPSTYIVLILSATPLSLTHELGHFFGAPHHKDPTNIMSYGVDRLHFNERQLKTFRYRARRYRKNRVLKRGGDAVGKPPILLSKKTSKLCELNPNN